MSAEHHDSRPADRSWWLVGNRHHGVSVGYGATAKEAKADVRARIAQAFEDAGHSPTAARIGASSYGVFAMAGNLTRDEAYALKDSWERGDGQPVRKAYRDYRNHLARLRRERRRG